MQPLALRAVIVLTVIGRHCLPAVHPSCVRNQPPLADPAPSTCHAFHSGRVVKAIYRGEVVAAKVRSWAARSACNAH